MKQPEKPQKAEETACVGQSEPCRCSRLDLALAAIRAVPEWIDVGYGYGKCAFCRASRHFDSPESDYPHADDCPRRKLSEIL